MDYDLTKPCAKCPFRTDCLKGWLGEDRAEEIAVSITDMQQCFPCHETTTFDDEGERVDRKDEKHCAGAMILLEKIDQPNQMMRIMERLGGYDRSKLKMESPVFDSTDEFVAHHAESKPVKRRKRSKA